MQSYSLALLSALRDFSYLNENWECNRYRALKGIYQEGDPCSHQIIGTALRSEYQGQDANVSEGFSFESCPD